MSKNFVNEKNKCDGDKLAISFRIISIEVINLSH